MTAIIVWSFRVVGAVLVWTALVVMLHGQMPWALIGGIGAGMAVGAVQPRR